MPVICAILKVKVDVWGKFNCFFLHVSEHLEQFGEVFIYIRFSKTTVEFVLYQSNLSCKQDVEMVYKLSRIVNFEY